MTIRVAGPVFALVDQSGYSKAANGRFAVFSVTVTAIKQHDLNPYDFYVTGANGRHYVGALVQFDPQLKAVILHPRERVHGNIVFDLPARARGTLVYAPRSSPLDVWRF